MMFKIETSLDHTESHFDKDFCPQVEIEYEVFFKDHEISAVKVLSIAEVPPKHHSEAAIHFIPLERLDEQDMKWILKRCLKDAEEQDYDAIREDIRSESQIDFDR